MAAKKLVLVCLSLVLAAAADADFFTDCPISNCTGEGPEIRYPFTLLRETGHRYPSYCGRPGFELTCRGNNTLIKLPYSGDFYVQSIDYTAQTLVVGDPQKCTVSRVLTPLNLSSSPFSLQHYNYDLSIFTKHRNPKSFMLFKCSSDASSMRDMGYNRFYAYDCLNGRYGNYVYVAESDEKLRYEPPSCVKLGEFNVNLPQLKYYIDLLGLTWSVPDCKSCEEKGGQCGFNATTNTTLCYQTRAGSLTWRAIIGIIMAVVFSALLAASFIYWDHKFRGSRELDHNKVERFLQNYYSLNPKRYSYSEVKRMINFQQKLGQGGFGNVYKGKLPDGVPVAVKMIEMSKSEGEEFINEVATIGRIHHVNVVRLLGFCAEQCKRALVYEFLPNGSLEKFIFSRESKQCELGWDKLHEIAVGIARGIEYLHQGCDKRILHFDIKPHNILLDHRFTPKISDFGLAKFCSKDQSIISMTAARGTMGYIAPEVASRNFGNISYKSDVYSFGMLLLEMVGKRKNIDVTAENTSQIFFPEWIYNRVDLHEELGIGVSTKEEDEIARKLLIVALWCIQWNPVDRPSMKKVVQMLEGETDMLEMPPKPFLSNIP